MSQAISKHLNPHDDPNRLGAGRFFRQEASFTTTPSAPAPSPVHSYPPQPSTRVLGQSLHEPGSPHHYPPQLLVETASDNGNSISRGPKNCGDNCPESMKETTGDVPLPSSPPPIQQVEIKAEEKTAVDPSSAKMNRHRSLDAKIILTVLIIFAAYLLSPMASVDSQEISSVFRCVVGKSATAFQSAVLDAFTWIGVVSIVDCAIPSKGARVIPEWTSPGTGDSGRWFYKSVLGLTVVPPEAVLDKNLPHWSFPGQSGHIAFELHQNATITTVIVESDFPESIPHTVRIWTFVHKPKQVLCCSQSLNVPPFPYPLGTRDLFPLLLGDVTFQTGTDLRERKYHIPRGCYGHVPVGVVMLEFLPNGGGEFTRIDHIRILGIPS